MKTTITILLLSAAIAAVMAYTASQTENTEVSVLVDITDTMLAQPETEEILALFRANRWNGRKFRYQNISDVDYNKVKKAEIESEQMWFSNSIMRDKKIERFYEEVGKILVEAKKDSIGRNNTSAFVPIATELNRLSKSKAEKRVLVIYSDLMENGAGISFYGEKNLNELKNNSDSLMKYFHMPLERLDGIAVYFIYEPLNNQDSERFRTVSEFYRAILENKGAEVYIGANLVIF